jgi:hypothetical protein
MKKFKMTTLRHKIKKMRPLIKEEITINQEDNIKPIIIGIEP